MPMILIQTMCNKQVGRHWLESYSWLSELSGREVAAEAGGVLQNQSCCKNSIVTVSNNVHNSVSPLIVPDFLQV